MWFLRHLILFFILASSCSATNTTFVDASWTKLRILAVFGHPGKSHFDVFLPLLEELARRGHDVTVLSHYPRSEKSRAQEPLPNYRDISLVNEKIGLFLDVVDLKKVDHSFLRHVKEVRNLRRMANAACESAFRNPRIVEFVKSGEKFDLMLTESFNTDCFMPIAYKFNVPMVTMSSHQIMPWMHHRFDNPADLGVMPIVFLGFTRPMDFYERVWNVLGSNFFQQCFLIWYHYIDQNLAEEVFGPGVPDIREIAMNITAMLVNTHYSLHGSRPLVPNIIEVGGLHIPAKSKPLPKDIAKFLDDGREGVLYFNLGSMVKASSMPEETVNMILRAIGSIPRKVIWKWEIDDLPDKPSNVLIKKWLPQFDILSHANVKCYFGHGGLLGLSEGIYNGVPMVLMPVFGDQFHNAAAAKTRGAAIVISYTELTENILRESLNECFNNTRYRENARKLSKAYRDRAASPLETAVWWTEYIARGNGLPYLKSEGANLSWYQRHLVDVALFLLAVSLGITYVVYLATKFLLRRVGVCAKPARGHDGDESGSKKKD